MIAIHKGIQTAIWRAGHSILVNPVNCIGVSGKGFAKEAAVRFPDFESQYRLACRYRQIVLGKCMYFPLSLIPPYSIIAFPTKHHWQDKTDTCNVETGLDSLHDMIASRVEPHLTIGLPAIGCGEGGLWWPLVKSMILDRLEGLPHKITVYPPTR
jgi:O-acetyl-ADP-ribose deacetylase (regulator of RNase III)